MKKQYVYDFTIRNRLKSIRLRICLSQDEVAYRSNISGRRYRDIEKGRARPSLLTALLLAEVLHESVDRVFWLEKKKIY